MNTKTRTAVLGVIGLGVVIGGVLIWRQLAGGPAPANGATVAQEKLEEALADAQQLVALGEDGRAAAVLDRAVREHVDNQPLRLLYADVLMDQDRLPEAYAQYEAALAIGPRTPEVEFAAGTVASMIGRNDRALEHYAAAQTGDMNNPDYPLYLAQVQRKTGDLAGAKSSILRAGQLDPDRAIVWGTLADIFLAENALGPAGEQIAKARKLEPDNVEWRLIEARILKRQGQPEEALDLLIGLDESEKSRPEIMQVLSECYGLLSRPADAAAMYVARAQADPSDRGMAREAAIWSERAGDLDAALEYAKRAAMLGDEAGRKMVERLQK